MKTNMASRLLSSDVSFRKQVVARIKLVVEEVDMAIYGRGNAGFGFVYNNLGDLIKKVQAVGATARPSLFQHAIEKKIPSVRNDSLEELRHNVTKLHEMQSRLNFMLSELEGLVKKG